MRILLFSDTHLTCQLDEKKFNFLKTIIKTADKVIINGDFWEGYSISFDNFIYSPWKHLFPLLKSKNTVYIFGNHDREQYLDNKTNLFSTVQTNQYKIKLNDYSFVFEHGNRLIPFYDETTSIKKSKVSRFVGDILEEIEKLATRSVGEKLLRYYCQKQNNKIKTKIKKELSPEQIFVCGHTHLAEFDKKNQFINTGRIKFGLGQYTFIDNRKISQFEEWYD